MKNTSGAYTLLKSAYAAVFKSAYAKGLAAAVVLTAGLAAGAAQAATWNVVVDAASGTAATGADGTITETGTVSSDVTKSLIIGADDEITISGSSTINITGLTGDPVGITQNGGTFKVLASDNSGSPTTTTVELNGDIKLLGGTTDIGATGNNVAIKLTTDQNYTIDNTVNLYSGSVIGSTGVYNEEDGENAVGKVDVEANAIINVKDAATIVGDEITFAAGSKLNVSGDLTVSGGTGATPFMDISAATLTAEGAAGSLVTTEASTIKMTWSQLTSYTDSFATGNSATKGAVNLSAGGTLDLGTDSVTLTSGSFSNSDTAGKIIIGDSTAATVKAAGIKVEESLSGSASNTAQYLLLESDTLTLGKNADGFSGATVHQNLSLETDQDTFTIGQPITLDNRTATAGTIDAGSAKVKVDTDTLTVKGQWTVDDLVVSNATSGLKLGSGDTSEYEDNTTVLKVSKSFDATAAGLTLAVVDGYSSGDPIATLDLTGATLVKTGISGQNKVIEINGGNEVIVTDAQLESELGRGDSSYGYAFKIQQDGRLTVSGDLTLNASDLADSQTGNKIGVSGSMLLNGNTTLNFTDSAKTATLASTGEVIFSGDLTIKDIGDTASTDGLTLEQGKFTVLDGAVSATSKLTIGSTGNSDALLTLSSATGSLGDVTVNNNTNVAAFTVNSGSNVSVGTLTATKGLTSITGSETVLTVSKLVGATSGTDGVITVSNGATLAVTGDGSGSTQDVSGLATDQIVVDPTSTIDLGQINDTLGIASIKADNSDFTYNTATPTLSDPINGGISGSATSLAVVDLTGVTGIGADGLTAAQLTLLKTKIFGSNTGRLDVGGAEIQLVAPAEGETYYSFESNADALISGTNDEMQDLSFSVGQSYNDATGIEADGIGTIAITDAVLDPITSQLDPDTSSIKITEDRALSLYGDSDMKDPVLTAALVGEDEIRYVAGVSVKKVTTGGDPAEATLNLEVDDAYVGDIHEGVTVLAQKDVTILKEGTKIDDINFDRIKDDQYGDFGESEGATATLVTADAANPGTYTAANFYLSEVESLADGSTVVAISNDTSGNDSDGEIYIASHKDVNNNGKVDADEIAVHDVTFIGRTFEAEEQFNLGANGAIEVTGAQASVTFNKDSVNLGSVTGGTLKVGGNLTIGQVAQTSTSEEDPVDGNEPATASARATVPATENVVAWEYHTGLEFTTDSGSVTVENGALAFNNESAWPDPLDEAEVREIIFDAMSQVGATTGLYLGTSIDTSTTASPSNIDGKLIIGNYSGDTAEQNQSYFGSNSVTVVNGSGLQNSMGGAALTTEQVNLEGDAKLVILNAYNGLTITTGTINSDVSGGYTVDGEGAWAGSNLFMSNGFLDVNYDSDGLAVIEASDDLARSRYNKLTSDEYAFFKDVGLNADNGNYVGHGSAGAEFIDDLINSTMSYDEQARSFDSLGRIINAGAVVQSSVLAARTTTDAIAQRTGVGAVGNVATVAAATPTGASVWLTPIYANSDSDSFDAGAFEYGADIDVTGVALGIDYTADTGFTAGVAMNMGSGDADSQGDLYDTSNDFDYFGMGIYGAYEVGAFKVAADFGYTFISSDIDQNNVEKFTTDTDSTVATFGIQAKYTFHVADVLDIAPHLGVRYLHLNVDDYDVYGGEYGNIMNGDSIDADIVQFPIGVTFSSDIVTGNWTFKPALDISIIPATGDTDVDSDVTFGDRKLSYNTDVVSDCYYGATIGIEAAYGDHAAFGLSYGYFGSSEDDAQTLMVSGRYTF